MLYQRFGINYNALPSRFRKGSVLVREQVTSQASLLNVRLLANTCPVNQLSGVETDNMGEPSPVQNMPLESLSLVCFPYAPLSISHTSKIPRGRITPSSDPDPRVI
jgi:Thg1 C terminal domain